MNLSALVIVGLRITALVFILRLVTGALPAMWLLSSEEKFPRTFSGLVIGIQAASGALIWAFAVPLGRAVTKRLPQELSFGAITLADCYSAAFLGIGLVQFSTYLGSSIGWLESLFKSAIGSSSKQWQETMDFYSMSCELVPLIFAVLLFFNGRKWAVWLAKNHTVETTDTSEPTPPATEVGGDNRSAP